MSRPFERVLLVGGPFDGTWREVEQGSTFIEAVHYPPASCAYAPAGPDAMMATFTRYRYDRQGWTVQGDPQKPNEYRFVFTHGHTSATLFDRLLEKYAPTSEQQIKQLEEELRFTRESLRIANEMIANHHRTRLGIK